jgi:hypothetical protein
MKRIVKCFGLVYFQELGDIEADVRSVIFGDQHKETIGVKSGWNEAYS